MTRPFRPKFVAAVAPSRSARISAAADARYANGAPLGTPLDDRSGRIDQFEPLSTVTARRFWFQQLSASQTATGRSLP